MFAANKSMFLNLITLHYERLNLHHVALLLCLLLYSYLGAVVFVHLEGSNEAASVQSRNAIAVRRSVAAKKDLVEFIQVAEKGKRISKRFFAETLLQ